MGKGRKSMSFGLGVTIGFLIIFLVVLLGPFKIRTIDSTSPTGSRNHLASFRFQNTFRLNV